jgi:hypothetical protein
MEPAGDIGLAADIRSSPIWHWPLAEQGYFIYRVMYDSAAASSVNAAGGPPFRQATIFGVADFDGDHGTGGVACLTPPYVYPTLTILGRGIYYDSQKDSVNVRYRSFTSGH